MSLNLEIQDSPIPGEHSKNLHFPLAKVMDSYYLTQLSFPPDQSLLLSFLHMGRVLVLNYFV